MVGQVAIRAPASIPALYAWGVTVAPAVWGRAPVPLFAEVSAIAGPVILAVGLLLEIRWGRRVRSPCLWAFTITCGACWASAAAPGDPLLDAAYVVAGVLAWGVLAMSWAAPPLEDSGAKARAVLGISTAADSFPRAALANTAFGVWVAIGLQVVAFDAKSPERALLLRLLSVAGGLAAVGVFTRAALAGYMRSRRP